MDPNNPKSFLDEITDPFHSGTESEDEFLWDHDRPHPMCIPHIVDNILSYLAVPDLRWSRLVNSQYNEIACHHLARKEVITFNKMSHLSSYLSLMPVSHNSFLEEDPLTMEQLLEKVVSDQDNTFPEKDNEEEITFLNKKARNDFDMNPFIIPPFATLAHSTFHFNFDPDDTELPDLSDFFENYGHQIRELQYTTDLIPLNFPKLLPHMGDIWKGRVNNLETLSLQIKWGCPAKLYEHETPSGVILPSVRKLVVDMLVTEREAERAANFLRELLISTPNLEEISIPGSKKFFDDYINVVLGRLILSLDLPRLSTLNFCLAFNPLQMLDLAQKQFPLKSLILDFAEVHHFSFPNQNLVLERSLQILFAQTSSILQNLHLCFPYNFEHPLHRFTFPEPMTNLRYLALGRFYGSVSILNNLPVIKKLDLWNVRFHDFAGGKDDEGQNLEMSSMKNSENCKELYAVPTRYLSITTVIS